MTNFPKGQNRKVLRKRYQQVGRWNPEETRFGCINRLKLIFRMNKAIRLAFAHSEDLSYLIV